MSIAKEIERNYLPVKEQLQHIIDTFNTTGTLIGDGGRNKIKIYKLNEKNINVKSFKIPNFINQIVYNYFRKSKARRSFEYANKLIKLDIGTPQPIAYFENSTPLGLLESYYVCEHLDYDLTYRELVTNSDYLDHENILRQFTKFTWQMHEEGIYFKDHSPGNTLVIKNGNDYNFYLVDLNRMSFLKLDFEARMKNFSRLTPKKEMVKTMSDAYAKLSGDDFEKIFEKMWFYTQQFQEKFHRRKRLKQKLFGKK
ncbi:MAG: Kdo domain containing protein [Flavobacteriaceae bacterium]|nr:Kdo domain containing protein [Flavobacteriaceae bacterium]